MPSAPGLGFQAWEYSYDLEPHSYDAQRRLY